MSPKIFADRVIQRVHELFPESDGEEVFAILERYRALDSDLGTERIHLDILHLSGGDKKTLPKWVDLALTDFRDLIMCAEYEYREGEHIKKAIPDGFQRP